MALHHSQPSSYSSVLHTYKDSQTEARRETYNRELTRQDRWNTQDGAMTKKCRVKLRMCSLAPHILVILPSWVFQPSCCVSSLNSGCDGTTKRLSSFDDRLIQLIAQIQESHLRGTTDFINFIEKIKLPKNTSLVSKEVTSLYMYTNIPQEQEGILQFIRRILRHEPSHSNEVP